jgi:hypothetical protein
LMRTAGYRMGGRGGLVAMGKEWWRLDRMDLE